MSEVKDQLFIPKYDYKDLHQNFLRIYNEKLPFARNIIKDWAEGFVDRDNKFVKEFQTTFNSSFWELYLFAAFNHLNLKINMDYDRPDFLIEGEDGFIVEATVSNHAKNGIPEWEKNNIEDAIKEWPLEKILDNSTLRLANSFISKSRKYLESYHKLEHVKGKPYVIAIAPFDSPFTNQQRMQAIHRVLYGFDRYIAIDWDENNRDILDAIYMDSIDKGNGGNVPLGYFTKPEFAHVSAVIFSNTATFSKVRILSDDPRVTLVSHARYNDLGTQTSESVNLKTEYEENLLDGLIVFHNPFAKMPLKNKALYNSVIAHSTFSIESKQNLSLIPHGFLFQRFIFTFMNENPPEEIVLEVKHTLEQAIKGNDNGFPKYHI